MTQDDIVEEKVTEITKDIYDTEGCLIPEDAIYDRLVPQLRTALTEVYTRGYEEGRESVVEESKLLSVGYYKGEMDFGVNCSIEDLTYDEMRAFREMVVVAIGQAESMWRNRSKQPLTAQALSHPKTITKTEDK